jgi:hypothetical protein
MDADLEARKDRLTPAQREEVQEYFLRQFTAAHRFALPERRRSMLARLPKPSPVILATHRWPQAWRRNQYPTR